MGRTSLKIGIVLLLLLMSISMAATTGKISGRVVDKETEEGLPGVNVVIEGTSMGAATDVDGYYFIINIPPDQYTLRADMMGYKAVRKTNVNVNIDKTTKVNFELEKEVIEGEEVTVTAEREIVQLDVSNTQAVVEPENIESTSFFEISDVLVTQPGIEGTSIRGGRIEESQFMVDGMLVEDEMTNLPYMKLNLSSVQEVQVLTGGFNAEYGDVRSGIINVVTKDGGDRYTGSIDMKYSKPGLKHFGPNAFGENSFLYWPYMDKSRGAWEGGNDYFQGWVDYANSLPEDHPHYAKPEENYAVWLWRHRSPDAIDELQKMGYDVSDDDAIFGYGEAPDWVGEVSLGGPVPFLDNVNFFATYRQEKTNYALPRVLNPSYKDRHGSLKLTYHINPSMKLQGKFLYGWQTGVKEINNLEQGNITNNPFASPEAGPWAFHSIFYKLAGGDAGGIEERYTGGLTFTHTLSPSTYYELQASYMETGYEQVLNHRDTVPMGEGYYGIKEGRLGTDEEVAVNGWEEYKRLKIGDVWYDETPIGFSPANWRDVSGYYFMAVGKLNRIESESNTLQIKGNITSQVNRFNQVKAGFEINHHDIHHYWSNLRIGDKGPQTQADGKPFSGAIYIQDKLEFEGLIANIGLRGDFRRVPDAPYFEPFSEYFGQYQSEDSLSVLPSETTSDFQLSPRLGISHPISQDAKIFFNYGHFYQWPSFFDNYRIYYHHATDYIHEISNPFIDPPKTIQYEVGYAHNILNLMELNISGYYKDITDEITNRSYNPITGRSQGRPVNNQYRDIRGIEVKLDMRRGRYVSGWATYNYMIASTGKWGLATIFEDPTKDPNYVSSAVSEPYARPRLRINLDLHTPDDFGPKWGIFYPIGGANINFLFDWKAGEKFTWNPDNIPYVEFNKRWKARNTTDLRFTKRLFRVGRIEPVFYVDVYNLFNQKYLRRSGFFWNAGQASNEFEEYMFSLKEGDKPGDIPHNGKKEYIEMPQLDWWTFLNKRQVFFGLRINFH